MNGTRLCCLAALHHPTGGWPFILNTQKKRFHCNSSHITYKVYRLFQKNKAKLSINRSPSLWHKLQLLPSKSLCQVFQKTNVIDSTHKETRYQTEHSGNNLFLKDQFLNSYAHTEKIQGPFRVTHIAKDRAACCQYFLVKYYGSES